MRTERDWSAPGAMDAWQAECATEQAITAATGKNAIERACEAMEAKAAASVEACIAARGARYRRNMPLLLAHLRDTGIGRIDRMTIDQLVTRVDAEIAVRLDEPSRYIGFGGENATLNLKAMRRHLLACQDAEREALCA